MLGVDRRSTLDMVEQKCVIGEDSKQTATVREKVEYINNSQKIKRI